MEISNTINYDDITYVKKIVSTLKLGLLSVAFSINKIRSVCSRVIVKIITFTETISCEMVWEIGEPEEKPSF